MTGETVIYKAVPGYENEFEIGSNYTIRNKKTCNTLTVQTMYLLERKKAPIEENYITEYFNEDDTYEVRKRAFSLREVFPILFPELASKVIPKKKKTKSNFRGDYMDIPSPFRLVGKEIEQKVLRHWNEFKKNYADSEISYSKNDSGKEIITKFTLWYFEKYPSDKDLPQAF